MWKSFSVFLKNTLDFFRNISIIGFKLTNCEFAYKITHTYELRVLYMSRKSSNRCGDFLVLGLIFL